MSDPERIVYTNYRSCIGYKTHDGHALVPVEDLDSLMLEIGYFGQDDDAGEVGNDGLTDSERNAHAEAYSRTAGSKSLCGCAATAEPAGAPLDRSWPSNHYPLQVWQERPGEYSYRCACGTVVKHQSFGPFTEHA